jgi:hypothetical protein
LAQALLAAVDEPIDTAMKKFARQWPLTCDVCQRVYETLASNSGCDGWAVCEECFDKADYLAYLEDRWPSSSDFLTLKKLRSPNEQ